MERLKFFLTVHKKTVILIGILILLLFGAAALFQKFNAEKNANVEEEDLAFDAEGPYAQLFPRRDGNALVLSLKRTSSYDAISYELAYTSKVNETAVAGTKILDEGDSKEVGGSIDRGVVGTIDTEERKGEYEQEILFGTCSKNVCKYDQGVENGTLTLHIKKDRRAFRMVTQWHLQKPDVALGILTSGDGHLKYEVNADRQTLALVGFTITQDLTGVPKLPSEKRVLGKVYALNVPIAKELLGGDVSFELAEDPPDGAKLYRYNGSKWEQLDTKVDGSKLSAEATGAGIFAVLISKE